MKFKKIIAMLLTLSMVLAMGSFTASADDATVANDVVLFAHKDGTQSGTILTVAATGTARTFSASGSGVAMLDEKNAPYTKTPFDKGEEVINGETNTYYNIQHSYALNNLYNTVKAKATSTTPFSYAEWMKTNPVLSFRTKLRVPATNTNSKTLSFTVKYADGINTSGKAANSNSTFTSDVKLDPASNTIILTGTSGKKEYLLPSLTFERDKWISIDVRTYLNDEDHPVIGIYIDDELALYSTIATLTLNSLAIYDYKFHMSNPTTAAYAPFHLDEISFNALDISKKPVIPVSDATPEEKVAEDLASITEPSSTNPITGASVNLDATGKIHGSTITWGSSHPSIISTDGKVNHLDLQYDTEVTLTATITNESASATKTFRYTVQAEQIKVFNEFTFDDLADDFEVTGFKAETNEEGKTTYSARNLGTNTGIDTDFFKFGSATAEIFKEHATVSSNYTGITNKSSKSLYVSTNTDGTTEDYAYLIDNSNYGIASHISSTKETVLVAGYDMYIPSDTVDSIRRGLVRYNTLGNASSYDFSSSAVINNGNLIFAVSVDSNANYIKLVPSTEYSVSPEVPLDQWFTVQHIVKIIPNASGVHLMKVYGVLDDVCYFECTYETTSLNFLINKMDFYICGTGKNIANIVTGFDNLHVTKIPYYTDTFTKHMPADYVYPLDVAYDTTNATITATGRVHNTAGNYCLALAIYDNNGRLQTIKSANTWDNEGKLEVVLDNASSYLAKGYKYKAFMFNSLSSLIPQVSAEEVTYSAD